MKKLFLSLVALVCAMVSYAQNTLVATLTHGDNIRMFYGANAYKDAYNAASNGDVINLSGGKFYAVDNITKAITVRGTGIGVDNPTLLENSFYVNVPASDSQRLTMEGIRTSGDITIKGSTTNPYFMKCFFPYVKVYESAQRVMFMSCEVNTLYAGESSTSQFIGSYVHGISTSAKSTEFINCVLSMEYYQPDGVRNSNIVNSIIVNTRDGYNFYSFPISTVPVNCISVGSGNPFSGTTGRNNVSGLNRSIFMDSNIYNDLTEEAKSKYLGYDDTPVGMYGGTMPRNMTPSYPRITKMNVANKTTADGKLSVEIEVSAAE